MLQSAPVNPLVHMQVFSRQNPLPEQPVEQYSGS